MVTETMNETRNIEKRAKRFKDLRPPEKWQIFLETNAKDAPVGEILRRYGLYSSELTKIRRQAEAGALKEFGVRRNSKKAQTVPYNQYARLEMELTAKDKALAQMSEEYLLIKKKVNWD